MSQFNGKAVDIAGDSEEPGTEIITYDKKKKKKGSVDNQLWFEDRRGVIRSKLGPGGFAMDSSGVALIYVLWLTITHTT